MNYKQAVRFLTQGRSRSNKTPDNPVRVGLDLIIQHYQQEEVRAYHDQIWAGPEGVRELKIASWSDTELLTMAECGWFLDTEIISWAIMV